MVRFSLSLIFQLQHVFLIVKANKSCLITRRRSQVVGGLTKINHGALFSIPNFLIIAFFFTPLQKDREKFSNSIHPSLNLMPLGYNNTNCFDVEAIKWG